MKIFFSLLLISFLSIPLSAQNEKALDGSWEGELNGMGQKLRMWVHFDYQEALDSLIITLDSPDQGVKDISVSSYSLVGNTLSFEIESVNGSYSGILNQEFDFLEGKWKQGLMTFNLNLQKSKDPLTLIVLRPQEPKPPFPYDEIELVIPNEAHGVEISATLTKAKGDGLTPTVILVSGSGPQNRDSEIFGHKPFWVIADFLTRNGVNVVRYDDRGSYKSTGKFSTATTFDLAADASAVVDFLMKREDINSTMIGIIGHSEGGMIAPIIASQRNDLAFIVMLAGPGSSGEEILYQQSAKIASLEGVDSKDILRTAKDLKQLYSVAGAADISYEDGVTELRKFYKKKRRFLSKKRQQERGVSEQQSEMIIQQIMSEWFRTFIRINPVNYLPFVKIPVFAVFGELDSQVLPNPSKELVEKYLKEAGNHSFIVREYPNLNHLFQHAKTGSPSEYSLIEETFSDEVLFDMLKFIQKSTNIR